MVKPCQVKDAMQRQDLHLFGGRMPKTGRVMPGNVGRDGDVSRKWKSVPGGSSQRRA